MLALSDHVLRRSAQGVASACALVLNSTLVVADEPASVPTVSAQDQALYLLLNLQDESPTT
jgi:ABC-type oligopeptide transport system ATPase subunit